MQGFTELFTEEVNNRNLRSGDNLHYKFDAVRLNEVNLMILNKAVAHPDYGFSISGYGDKEMFINIVKR